MLENTIAGISRLMHNVQGSRIPIQDLADKVAAYFAPMVLMLSKPGTLTEGNLSVAEFYPFTDDAASLVYHLTKTSTHPVAKAVTEHVNPLSASVTTPKLGSITSVAGQGFKTKLGQRILWGRNCRWLNLGEHPTVHELRGKSRTIVAVTLEGEPIAIFGLVDRLRLGAEELIQWLTQREVEVYILSGDEPSIVESVAAQLEIRPDHAVGGCTPKSKADFVRTIQEKGHSASKSKVHVMFIGDGTMSYVRSKCERIPPSPSHSS